MITLDDIVINQNTFKDILKAAYCGYDIVSDQRKIGILRGSVSRWEGLSTTQKKKCRNDLIVTGNVFDQNQLMRFLLSNLSKERWSILITLAFSADRLKDVYKNVKDGKDVISSDFINKTILKELD